MLPANRADRKKLEYDLKKQKLAALAAEKDRKKKRQIEADFDARLADLRKKKSDNDSSENDNEGGTPKQSDGIGKYGFVEKPISKSELKRQKAEQKRRQEMGREREIFAATSQSEREEAMIAGVLKEKQWTLQNILPDGNCLFRAIQHQISLAPNVESSLREKDFRDIRRDAANYIKEHKGDFIPFLDEKWQTDEGFEIFVHDVAESDGYGGEIEINALCRAYGVTIRILQASGISEYGDGSPPPLTVSFHRHLFGSPHYNSVMTTAVS